jgi:ubiquinone biosynthesis monooxygenase Coq7
MTNFLESMTIAVDDAIRTLFAKQQSARPHPASGQTASLSEQERKLSASLMRVNHVGEVCAQAMYSAQAIAVKDPVLRKHFRNASKDEADHLAWTARRLTDLDSRQSVLNPVWYAGAFAIGLVIGRVSDKVSLGFVVETERQVEQHLTEHLQRLPEKDLPSRATVEQMRVDESQHALNALEAGAAPLPKPVRIAMRMTAKLMTATAYHI